MKHALLARLGVVALFSSLVIGCSSEPNQKLASGFANPPDSAKPRTWWHWVSGNVTKEGITADLEAMKRIGVGGAQCFSVDQVPDPKDRGHVLYMSDEWRALTKHAISEANRLGLELSITDCEGWSESGGQWIKPEQSMQKIVWTEEQVAGGTTFEDALPQPEAVKDFYQDIAVFAFPSLPGEQAKLAALKPKVTSSSGEVDGAKLWDGDVKTTVTARSAKDGQDAYVQIEFAQPLRAGSFTIAPVNPNTRGELQISDDDGKTYRKLVAFSTNRKARDRQTLIFDEVNARFFRIAVPKAKAGATLSIGEIDFGSARVPDYRVKTAMESRVLGEPPTGEVPSASIVQREKLVDLTDKFHDGKLSWDAPEGEWTIIRIGHTSTGKTNHPAMAQTVGLECNKLDPEAVKAVYDGMLAKIIAENKPLIGSGLKYVLMDSWEAGCENWSSNLRAEFQKRRGYDPLPWLVTMSGRYVESTEKTERFLWDWRRTIGDLVAENHYGLMKKLLNANKIGLYAEAPGIGMPTTADELQCKGRTDIPMGEFWVNRAGDEGDTREAASAAHIYGKTVAAAESFTATPENAAWTNDPFSLKQQGDREFCNGINRYVFHRYAHQPWLDRYPGMTMGPWGINFERTNTWWEPGKAWITYISRCQYMLQQGLFNADIVYYYGEDVPNCLQPSRLNPPPPKGYNYDACNKEVLLTRMSVKDGRIVLLDGMSYRVLVLPATNRMSPEVARKVKQLVADGATVVGPKPNQSPSLADYPKCDDEVKRIAHEVWADCDGKTSTERSFGKGKIIDGKKLDDVLAGVSPDFTTDAVGDDAAQFRFIHRGAAGAEIYFVSSQQEQPAAVECSFRVSGRKPQFWHPDTGKIEDVAVYSMKDGRTSIPIRFDPAGSVFVVFGAKSVNAEAVTSFAKSGKRILPFAEPPTLAKNALEIHKATYGVLNGTENQQIDVTDQVEKQVKGGSVVVGANNDLAGRDPAYNLRKQLRVEYTFNGKRDTLVVDEGRNLRIPGSSVGAFAATASRVPAELSASNGHVTMTAFQSGDYTVAGTSAKDKGRSVHVDSVPGAMAIDGPWDVRFPPQWGAPSPVTFESLISWTKHLDEGVKHFSGTASYVKDIDIPEQMLAKGNRVYLDLGEVKNLAEVKLNGKDVATLWKPPFRVEITSFVKPGRNHLVVAITNLWPNRLIGDAGQPENRRYTWSAYNRYKATDPLLPSGLLGPVKLVPAVTVQIK